MDYRDKVFISAAENLSFSKAAAFLHISQPAVTRHIRELEERYRTNLFDRRGNKIYLTKAGEKVYNALKQIEKQYRELEFEVGQMHASIAGEFRIGASTTIAQYVIPKILGSFHKRYPKVQIFLSSGNSLDMENMLINNQIDLALVENFSSQSGIRYRKFLDDELIVVTGSQSVYAKRDVISREDLVKIPLVLREQGSGTLEVIEEALVKHGFDITALNTVIHLGSTESIKNFLQDFDGLAIVSARAVISELYHRNLVKLRLADFSMPRAFRIADRLGYKSPIVDLFEEFLISYNM